MAVVSQGLLLYIIVKTWPLYFPFSKSRAVKIKHQSNGCSPLSVFCWPQLAACWLLTNVQMTKTFPVCNSKKTVGLKEKVASASFSFFKTFHFLGALVCVSVFRVNIFLACSERSSGDSPGSVWWQSDSLMSDDGVSAKCLLLLADSIWFKGQCVRFIN